MSAILVVIPCYNGGEFLIEAVLSARQQSISVRVIVVDDGSDDPRTLMALEEASSMGVTVLRSPNRGLPTARNQGWRSHPCDYVVFLDCDDVLSEKYCEACSEALEQDQQLGLSYSRARVFGDERRTWGWRHPFPLRLIVDNGIPYAAMVRYSALEQVGGYDETLKDGYEDWDLWLRLAKNGWRIGTVEDGLFSYRKHGDSMLSATYGKQADLRKALRQRHAELYRPLAIAQRAIRDPKALPFVGASALRVAVRSVISSHRVARFRRWRSVFQ